MSKTLEDILADRKAGLKNGYYMPLGENFDFCRAAKEMIVMLFENDMVNNDLQILCSHSTKVKLRAYFWGEDFNYYGTRVRLIGNEHINEQSFSTIPDRQRRAIFYSDVELNKPVGVIEYTS